MSYNESELKALVSMVDEPDPEIFSDISGRIINYGQYALPYLEYHLKQADSDGLRVRLESIMQGIRQEGIFSELERLCRGNDSNELLQAWICVSRLHYPDISEEDIGNSIDKIRSDVWLEMNEKLTALEQVKVFNHVFYELHKFGGNIEDYHNPDNLLINRVLETKTGNPLSIGILYMAVARSANLPITGINLPEHFVLAYMGETIDTETLQIRDDKALFYINAFSEGAVFSAREINMFLRKLKMEALPEFFNPCSNRDIVLRMLGNLSISYAQSGQEEMKEVVESIRERLQG